MISMAVSSGQNGWIRLDVRDPLRSGRFVVKDTLAALVGECNQASLHLPIRRNGPSVRVARALGSRAPMDSQGLNEYCFRYVSQGAHRAICDRVSAFLYERVGRPEHLVAPAAGSCRVHQFAPRQQPLVRRPDLLRGGRGGPSVHAFVSNFLEHLPSQEATGRPPALPDLVGLYLRLSVAWRLLGKQFLVIGRKA
jgi:hypothetical protein